VLQEAWRNPAGRVGTILLLVITVSAVVGPWFLPDPLAQPDILAGSLPPGLGHPFGTDQLNRDVLARVVTGARVSLSVAVLAVGLSVTIGAAVGLVSGYWGGMVDAGLMRLVDGALAIPRLFILLLVLATMERVPLPALILLIGATGWFARFFACPMASSKPTMATTVKKKLAKASTRNGQRRRLRKGI